jgi:hypothetical protein
MGMPPIVKVCPIPFLFDQYDLLLNVQSVYFTQTNMIPMQKVLFLLSFLFVVGAATANAQSCGGAKTASAGGKSCCASKAASAAKSDATIESRVAEDGTVSYMRKEADQTGNVRLVSVQYDEASNAFVNVAPKGSTSTTTATDGMVKKSCGTSATTATGGKACCSSGKAEGKSCCAKKEQ